MLYRVQRLYVVRHPHHLLSAAVLGPLLFIVYTADHAAIPEKHDVFLHTFADDTQLYLHCCHADTASAAAWLE